MSTMMILMLILPIKLLHNVAIKEMFQVKNILHLLVSQILPEPMQNNNNSVSETLIGIKHTLVQNQHQTIEVYRTNKRLCLRLVLTIRLAKINS